jgi:1,4-alpha-glucan branching enzyme
MITDHQYISRKDDRDKVIIFEKGDLVFVFNFHWQKSFTDYRVGCIKPGEYRVHVEKTKDLNMLKRGFLFSCLLLCILYIS